MKNEKRSFLLYENYEKLFGLLPMEQRGMLITAIFEYERQQLVSVTLSDAANMAFQCIKDTLDRDREAYLEKCKKQSENGKKGGRPSKATLPEKTQKTQWFSEKTKKADNDNDNDNDIDNDIDNGNGNENENDIASEWESVNETDSSAHTSPTAFPAPPIGTPSPTAPRLSQEEREKLIAEHIGKYLSPFFRSHKMEFCHLKRRGRTDRFPKNPVGVAFLPPATIAYRKICGEESFALFRFLFLLLGNRFFHGLKYAQTY